MKKAKQKKEAPKPKATVKKFSTEDYTMLGNFVKNKKL